jgi:hypothetical protein
VLPFIAQHMNEIQDVCNSLQVSRVWRECLAQCSGCIDLAIVVGLTTSLTRTAAVASWLQRYGRLVERIEFVYDDDMVADHTADMAVAESLIAQACQLAAAQLRPLQTARVSKDDLQTPAFLSSLPAYSLTRLTLEELRPSSNTIGALARGLGHLTGLRELSMDATITFERAEHVFPAACLSGLKQLSNLTVLILSGDPHQWGSGLEQYLPAQLKSICAYGVEAISGDLRHLTGLTDLVLVAGDLSLTQLPIQLQELTAKTTGECVRCRSPR